MANPLSYRHLEEMIAKQGKAAEPRFFDKAKKTNWVPEKGCDGQERRQQGRHG